MPLSNRVANALTILGVSCYFQYTGMHKYATALSFSAYRHFSCLRCFPVLPRELREISTCCQKLFFDYHFIQKLFIAIVLYWTVQNWIHVISFHRLIHCLKSKKNRFFAVFSNNFLGNSLPEGFKTVTFPEKKHFVCRLRKQKRKQWLNTWENRAFHFAHCLRSKSIFCSKHFAVIGKLI